jgi:hypothetical protein
MPRELAGGVGGQRRYRLDRLEMPDILALAPKLRAKVMYQGVKVVTLYVREHAPDSGVKRKGKLKKSIQNRVKNYGRTGYVLAKAPHAHLVHDGTAPHRIHARSKESARAGWRFYRGSVHRAVKHPGARAQPFLLEAAEATRDDVEQVMAETAEIVVQEVAAGR